jgi:L-alanine-DL-glutamate epimerase-like enolase superfamily enzyme
MLGAGRRPLAKNPGFLGSRWEGEAHGKLHCNWKGRLKVSAIETLETFRIHLEPRRRAVMRGQPTMPAERVLVRLRTDDGLAGWGEATAQEFWGGMLGRYFGETNETVLHAIHDLLAPSVLAADPKCPAVIAEDMDARLVGHPFAKAALEMAVQDLRGQTLGEPVARLISGRMRGGTRVAHMIGLMSESSALQEADRALSDGITAFQVKGGEDISRDVKLIRALRQAVPPATFLRLDANQGYGRQPKVAASAVKQLAEAGVDAVEQPGASAEVLARCREAVDIPIIADEACWTAADLLELWRDNAVDAVSIYVAKTGGIEPAIVLATMAHEVGFACDLNGSLETGIGTAASLHVSEAAPGATFASVVPIPMGLTQYAGNYHTADVVASGFTYRDGILYVSADPGLGIRVDEERVRALTAPDGYRRMTLRDTRVTSPSGHAGDGADPAVYDSL